MAKYGLNIIFLLVLISSHRISSNATPTNFIKSSCRATRYPALCIRSLSDFNVQTEKQLAHVALAVSLAKARAFSRFVSNMSNSTTLEPRESQAVNDCIRYMGDATGQLAQSIHELGRATGLEFAWHVSNMQTWASAALTNQISCVDGFAGPTMDGSAKVALGWRINGVSQATSIALALVNQFAARQIGHKLP